MNEDIKSGKEILDDFFKNLEKMPNIDKKIVDILTELYRDKKLSQKFLSNALLKDREERLRV